MQDSQCLSHRGYAEQMQTVSSEVVKNYGKPQKILTSLILWVQIRQSLSDYELVIICAYPVSRAPVSKTTCPLLNTSESLMLACSVQADRSLNLRKMRLQIIERSSI